MRRLKRLTAAGVLAAGVLGGTTLSAQAHDLTAFNPPDPSYGRFYDHSRLHPCDWHADGNRVRIRFTIYPVGTGYFYTEWDSYGPDASGAWCGLERIVNPLREFWLCIENEGCGLGVRH